MNNEVAKEAEIIKKRSAFFMYVEEGITIVEAYFPQQLKYVEANKDKSLRQVFDELEFELKSVSKN